MTDKVPELHVVERAANPEWVEMPLSRRIVNIVRSCSAEREIALIVTAPGLGKTVALEKCAAELPNVVMVTLCRASGSLRGGLLEIAHALARHPDFRHLLNIRPAHYTNVTSLWLGVMNALEAAQQGSTFHSAQPVLVVDEAQAACLDLLETLRSLYDRGFCSLVIAGNHNFRTDRLDALLSRLDHDVNRLVPAAEDVAAFCRAYGVTVPKSRQLLRQVADVRGIRGVHQALRRARAGGGGAALSPAAIEAAIKSMRFAASEVWERQRGKR